MSNSEKCDRQHALQVTACMTYDTHGRIERLSPGCRVVHRLHQHVSIGTARCVLASGNAMEMNKLRRRKSPAQFVLFKIAHAPKNN